MVPLFCGGCSSPHLPPDGFEDGVVQEARLIPALLLFPCVSADEWFLPTLPDGSLHLSRAAWALT